MTRRMVIVTLFGLILSAATAKPQAKVEHAPTVEQCRADGNLWLAKLQENTESWSTTVKDVPATILIAWGKEMGQCRAVDPASSAVYDKTVDDGLQVLGARKDDFLIRHDLMTQFFQEDEAGKR